MLPEELATAGSATGVAIVAVIAIPAATVAGIFVVLALRGVPPEQRGGIIQSIAEVVRAWRSHRTRPDDLPPNNEQGPQVELPPDREWEPQP